MAETRVKEVEQELIAWKESVNMLHSEYNWLLFFRIPKLLKLYHLIMDDIEDKESKVVHEISFLCSNTAEDRLKTKERVEVSYALLVLYCSQCIDMYRRYLKVLKVYWR